MIKFYNILVSSPFMSINGKSCARKTGSSQKNGDFLAALSSQWQAEENVLRSKPKNKANKKKKVVVYTLEL